MATVEIVFPKNIKEKPRRETSNILPFKTYIYHYPFLLQNIFIFKMNFNCSFHFWITDILRNFLNSLFSFSPVPLKYIQNRAMKKWLDRFYAPRPCTSNVVVLVILDNLLSETDIVSFQHRSRGTTEWSSMWWGLFLTPDTTGLDGKALTIIVPPAYKSACQTYLWCLMLLWAGVRGQGSHYDPTSLFLLLCLYPHWSLALGPCFILCWLWINIGLKLLI